MNSTFKYISLISLLTTSAAARPHNLSDRAATEMTGERFRDFLSQVTAATDSLTKRTIVNNFVDEVRAHGRVLIEDSTVYFLYRGKATRVGIPSDLNSWDPASDTMKRIPRTNMFYLAMPVNVAARFEYKFVVDSTWILDPMNQQQAMGGYGPNSEIRMPGYSPPKEIEYRRGIPHGTVDTLMFKSKLLGRTHPVFIYKPPGYRNSGKALPCIYVTDGGEYISLALMLNVLDNLVADRRIQPLVGIFIDPRTDVRNPRTSSRMTDYASGDTLVNALASELRPQLMKKYKLTTKPDQTAIMGASLGGLFATYAACTRPDVFGLCAAQSPAYWYRDSSIFRTVQAGPKRNIKFYIDTGTIRDTQPQAARMRTLLLSKGYEVSYGEYPEGHNWANWRARLADILTYFWGVGR